MRLAGELLLTALSGFLILGGVYAYYRLVQIARERDSERK